MPYVGNTKKYLKRGVKPLMSTKGMTSIEIAILVAIVLAIAIAAGWYLYTTFSAAVGAQPPLRIVSAIAFANGTIRLEVINTGSSGIGIVRAEVFDRVYPVRGGGVWTDPGSHVIVYVDTGRGWRIGSIIQGKLIAADGQVLPFSARVII